MGLRFMFLLIMRLTAWLRLSQREETWKTAEILILRHQFAVLQQRQPRRPNLNWADRALLATLLSVIPKARRHGMRLLVTPDTILRWHRDLVRRRWAARSRRGRTGRPATHHCRSEARRTLHPARSYGPIQAMSKIRMISAVSSAWNVSNPDPEPNTVIL